jgi:hypothetical protein
VAIASVWAAAGNAAWRGRILRVALSLMYRLLVDVLHLLTQRRRGDAASEVEIVVLRHRVAVLRRQVRRVDLVRADAGGAPGVVSGAAPVPLGGVLCHPDQPPAPDRAMSATITRSSGSPGSLRTPVALYSMCRDSTVTELPSK